MYINSSCLRSIIVLNLVLDLCTFKTVAQTAENKALKSDIAAITHMRKQLPVEKLYLQTDKSTYVQNDTLWFKAYLLNADYLTASTRSGLLYAELDDENDKCIKRMMFPVISGVSWGNIALNDEIPGGSYTLRAYTNWMQNFGGDYIFTKSIYIVPSNNNTDLVAARFGQSKQAGKDNIRASIIISNMAEQPLRLRDMELKIMDGRHTLLKSNATTGIDGKMDINFDLPENTGAKNLSIVAQDVTKGANGSTAVLTIPITLNRPDNTDLQFMPEGGALLAGVSTKIGFKAIAGDGKGTDVSGRVYSSKQQQVCTIKSAHRGMGVFELNPQAGESYTARLELPDGSFKSYPLPTVNSSGTGLSVADIGTDTLQVTVFVKPGIPDLSNSSTYYLLGQSRGVVCYGAQFSNINQKTTVLVPKSLFPTGIARFSLLNAANQPLNERICFINHQDNLQINIATTKKSYAPHDSIALNIQVTNKKGLPVQGSFSVAVTDDSQVKTDSITNNIENNLLLTSDLKGAIEEPGYYFDNTSPERMAELDNLMLTQGWIAYDWKQVFGPDTVPLYAPEHEFTVQGKVTNVFNKPVAGTGVVLFSKKPILAMDTITDNNGRFAFNGIFPVDTAAFVIQAKNKHKKSFNVGITMDEFKPPVFITQTMERVAPWYVNSDTVLLHALNSHIVKQQAELKLQGPHVLKEVAIKAKYIKGSKNLNGDGGADEVLDEKDMEKAGKMTLRQLLQKKAISGLTDAGDTYRLHFNRLFFIIDGVNVDRFFYPQGITYQEINEERYQFLNTYLDNITAEDVTGIEAMYNYSHYIKYDMEFYPQLVERVGDPNYAYIEITTRSGHGAFMQATPGVYEYKPLAFSLSKLFYRPKYTTKSNKSPLPDLRSTIHWEPNIVTDTAGKATVSFYSADKPANYTIILDGSDLNGSVGYQCKKVVVH